MIQTYEAIIEPDGRVLLLESVRVARSRRALVTILEEEATHSPIETALLSEPSLARDWDSPEEDEAWSHLQSDR